ncbi:uncharacterized protein LOC120896923 [Anopheles arabiensis]|uniref:AGAP001896-PA n=4 Tax=gambiae species complex TaxID=44542 RepID=A0NGV8_ANOGA|nr:uncharacterized protein LOC120896923 [Anopheles arabiensis]XP_040226168.2 uncharacterized protein LOC120951473 [Anopheles coluzzii]EAU75608.1 AGAP001896-PA [Anopheles gambiae str. PEST]
MASHSSFYQGTKRISPLKIRNPSILPSQIMPSPTGAPFNFAEMPWSYGMKPGQVMEFNAVIRPSPITGPPSPIPQMPSGSSPPSFGPAPVSFLPELRKRKPDPDVIPIPSKQFLTEEVMSSHFNNLHLSTEYTAHDIRTQTSTADPRAHSSREEDMLLGDAGNVSDDADAYHVCMSPQELEERLKKAQRIAICEEVRRLDGRGEILPKALLQRIEKPCTALMIWQPPQERVQSVLSKVAQQLEEREREERKAMKNNNNSEAAPDSMAISDEPLPDLPDYDEDLDFEPDGSGAGWPQGSAAPDPATMDVEM